MLIMRVLLDIPGQDTPEPEVKNLGGLNSLTPPDSLPTDKLFSPGDTG